MEYESTVEHPPGSLPGAETGAEPPEALPVGFEHRRLKASVRQSLFGANDDGPAGGGRIGRFTVLRRLGAGGMGIVYSAYDDELERKVAIKLLRADRRGEGAEARLRREAQAIARLSHPNVIGVFEVGRQGGALFVAMEFVRGQTLRAWLEEADDPGRTPDEILGLYLQAAAGLAAAHEADLVHRDFKPDNVMIGEDGRVRVLDFGLAAVAGEAIERDEDPPTPDPKAKLTLTGAIMGTPRYMAPEQHAGLPADARSDQFSWCVSVWEALFGAPPFAGDSVPELVEAIERGPTAPPKASVHPAVRAVLARGLAREPSERWPSMPALVRELERTQRRPRRAVLAGGAILVGGGLSALALWPTHSDCPPGEEKLAPVWSEARIETARAALARSGTDVSLQRWHSVESELDAYAAGWARAHEASCDPELAAGERLERQLCLEQHLESLREITDQLVAGTLALPDEPLPDPAICGDVNQRRALARLESQRTAPAPQGASSGLVSDFDEDLSTAFGAGWQVSTDQIIGGNSTAKITRAPGSAGNDTHTMRVAGTVEPGGPALWAGAMFFAGETPMSPANLTSKSRISFTVRGTPGTYTAMLFTTRTGFSPKLQTFEVDADWRPVSLDLDAFDPERFDATAFFVGAGELGDFELFVDDVRLD